MKKLAGLQALSVEHAAVGREELVAFAKLPLLRMSSTDVVATAVPQLAGLTCVTHLDIKYERIPVDEHVSGVLTLQQLASALQHLTQLVSLGVDGSEPHLDTVEASLPFAFNSNSWHAIRACLHRLVVRTQLFHS
jgi:hypothetical protein